VPVKNLIQRFAPAPAAPLEGVTLPADGTTTAVELEASATLAEQPALPDLEPGTESNERAQPAKGKGAKSKSPDLERA
jgi:hypothetical protein